MAEVVSLAAEGLTDKEIAHRLGISPHTVSTHWKRLRAHFVATSRAEVIAKIASSRTAKLVEQDTEERDRLHAEIEVLALREAALRQTVEALEETIRSRNEFIAASHARNESQQRSAMIRLEELEHLNRLAKEFRLIPNEGTFGSSWNKTWISECMSEFGYMAEDVLNGKVNVFNTIHAEDLPHSLAACGAAEHTGGRILLTHRFITATGETRHLMDFLILHPVDKNEVGRVAGMAIDITDWLPMIRRRIAEGWPDLPLQPSDSPV